MQISLKDVAEHAGVSLSTVSHVLNDRTAARIAAKTQQRVRQSATILGYQPNNIARSLASNRTNTFKLITSSHDNPFFVRVAKAVDASTRGAGYRLAVDATLNEIWNQGAGKDVWPVDGALIWADTTVDLATFLGGRHETTPVVYMGFQGDESVDAVATDFYSGSRQAAEHLVARGYRKIAYLSPFTYGPEIRADYRKMAYEDVCRESGREARHIHFLNVEGESEYKSALRAGLDIAALPERERPDAVICFNDIYAISVYHGIRRARLRVPEDIAVVGFDGTVEGQCLDLLLTSVLVPVEAMCQAAVDMLLLRVGGDRETPPQRLLFPTELMIGETT